MLRTTFCYFQGFLQARKSFHDRSFYTNIYPKFSYKETCSKSQIAINIAVGIVFAFHLYNQLRVNLD